MKLSEFMRKMNNEIRFDGYSTASIVEILLDARKRGAEAAGVVWDPEEPRLAEEISCGLGVGGALLGRIRNEQMTGIWFGLDREDGAPFDVRATVLEAVRRYNAWPKLWQLVKEHDTVTSMRLRLILLGKDGAS